MRANDPNFDIIIEKEYNISVGLVNVIPQDMSRVFLNILNNAMYVVNPLSVSLFGKGGDSRKAEGVIKVTTMKRDDTIEIRIRDNDPGIVGE